MVADFLSCAQQKTWRKTRWNLWVWDFCTTALAKLLGPLFPESISLVAKRQQVSSSSWTPLPIWSTSFFCFNHIVRLHALLVFKNQKRNWQMCSYALDSISRPSSSGCLCLCIASLRCQALCADFPTLLETAEGLKHLSFLLFSFIVKYTYVKFTVLHSSLLDWHMVSPLKNLLLLESPSYLSVPSGVP